MFIGEPSRACIKWNALQMYVFVLRWQKKKRKLLRFPLFIEPFNHFSVLPKKYSSTT